MNLHLDSEQETRTCAAAVAAAVTEPVVMTLQGALGAGKTTWVRAFLEARGHTGVVPSPTYTLVEPYELGPHPVYHIDLYRLQQVEELDELGVRELLSEPVTVLIEWPERWPGIAAHADLNLQLTPEPEETARRLEIQALRPRGEALLARVDFL